MSAKSWKRFLKKTLPPLIAPVAQGVLSLILKTCTIDFKGVDHLKKQAKKGKCMLALWHQYLAPAANFLHRCAPEFNYHPVISASRDGEILTRFLRNYPQCSPLRIPHNRRHLAVKNIIEKLHLPNSVVVITPDGPRGPRGKVKGGASFAAAESGAEVIPMTWEADKYWTLNTWDKMRIPRPFSRITVIFKKPLSQPSSSVLEQSL